MKIRSILLACLTAAYGLAAEEVYFEVDGSNQTFVIRLTDPAAIREARAIVSGAQTDRVSVSGLVVKAPALYNPRYSFHLDAGSISFFSFATEVCDAAPGYVEEHLAEVGGAFLPGNRWCPWNSKVAREVPAPPGTERMLTVTSAASLSEVAVSPGSLASAFATGMTERTESATTAELPETLAGLTVEITQAGETQPHRAGLLFASPNQVNFLVPEAVKPGVVSVRVSHASGARFEGASRAQIVAPGIFFSAYEQQNYAAALLVRVRPDGTQIVEPLLETNTGGFLVPRAAEMKSPDEKLYLCLYGTGIRNVSADKLQVVVGSDSVPVLFAGAQGVTPGLDQINLELPPTLWNAPLADIRISAPVDVGTLNGNTVRILLKRSGQ